MMTPATGYHFPERALARWAREQLALDLGPEGGVATFRLDGSTCGNLPFALHYRIRWGPAAAGHPVIALEVVPAPGDTDHARTCLAEESEAAWRAALADLPPVLGQPLAQALDWRPKLAPSGCLCTATYRAHKWRAALETLHYALTPPAAANPS